MRLAVLVLGAFVCGAASAQVPDQPSEFGLYSNPSFYGGSSRAMALGGAFVAVADGAAWTSNHASFAQPSAWAGDWWGLSLSLQGAGTGGVQDLDNDRQLDGRDTYQALFGIQGRVKSFGFGLYGRSTVFRVCESRACLPTETVAVTQGTTGASGALALFEGQLVTAVGVHTMLGRLAGPGVDREFGGAAFGLDVLYRPRNRPFRVGATYRPGITADLTDGPGEPFAVNGRAIPHALISPHVISLGMAARIDRGGHLWNVERERADDPMAAVAANALIRDIFRTRKEEPPARWLVTTQLDLTLPVRGAVQLEHFARGSTPIYVATSALFTPRVGIEHVTAPGRLRLRGGSYLEPSPWPDTRPRVHATFGFDLFVFHFLLDWGFTGAIDVAQNVQQGSLSFGVWD